MAGNKTSNAFTTTNERGRRTAFTGKGSDSAPFPQHSVTPTSMGFALCCGGAVCLDYLDHVVGEANPAGGINLIVERLRIMGNQDAERQVREKQQKTGFKWNGVEREFPCDDPAVIGSDQEA